MSKGFDLVEIKSRKLIMGHASHLPCTQTACDRSANVLRWGAWSANAATADISTAAARRSCCKGKGSCIANTCIGITSRIIKGSSSYL